MGGLERPTIFFLVLFVPGRRADWSLKKGKRKFRCETCTEILEGFVARSGLRPNAKEKTELLAQDRPLP